MSDTLNNKIKRKKDWGKGRPVSWHSSLFYFREIRVLTKIADTPLLEVDDNYPPWHTVRDTIPESTY